MGNGALFLGAFWVFATGCEGRGSENVTAETTTNSIATESAAQQIVSRQDSEYFTFRYLDSGCNVQAYYLALELAVLEIPSVVHVLVSAPPGLALQNVKTDYHLSSEFENEPFAPRFLYHAALGVPTSGGKWKIWDPTVDGPNVFFDVPSWKACWESPDELCRVQEFVVPGSVFVQVQEATGLPTSAVQGQILTNKSLTFAAMPAFATGDVLAACQSQCMAIYFEQLLLEKRVPSTDKNRKQRSVDATQTVQRRRDVLWRRTRELTITLQQSGKMDRRATAIAASGDDSCASRCAAAVSPP